MDLRETMACAIWESQRREISDPEGINARLTWRSLGAPEKFWDGYLRDADAALLAYSTYAPGDALC